MERVLCARFFLIYGGILIKDLRINDEIRAKQVRLIDENGNQVGIVDLNRALDMAYDSKLDLVLMSPKAKPPVTRIMDYGKFKYDQEKKEKESSKSNRFAPPSVDDVRAYCLERGNNIDPDKFVDYYTANGWMVGRNKMKDWKATVRSWERNDFNSGKKEQKKYGANGIELDTERDPIDEELDKLF